MLTYKEVREFVRNKGPVTARTVGDQKEVQLGEDDELSAPIIEQRLAVKFKVGDKWYDEFKFEQLIRGEGEFFEAEMERAWKTYTDEDTPIIFKDRCGRIIREFKSKSGKKPEVIEVNRAEWEKSPSWEQEFAGAESGRFPWR